MRSGVVRSGSGSGLGFDSEKLFGWESVLGLVFLCLGGSVLELELDLDLRFPGVASTLEAPIV